ncbi:unnamed protein product [Brassica oleracea var. botrytis]
MLTPKNAGGFTSLLEPPPTQAVYLLHFTDLRNRFRYLHRRFTARREKINTRIKLLHELVPGCDKQWLSRAANVFAGDFKGDGADDAEEENNDFFYDSEADHVHYVIKILFFLLYFQASIGIFFMRFSEFRDFYDSE